MPRVAVDSEEGSATVELRNLKTKALMKKTLLALSLLLPLLGASSGLGDESEIEIIKNVRYLGQARELTLDLYLPADRSTVSRPAILIVHGGGWHTGDKAAKREINIASNLAKAGFVCASVNYLLAKKQDSFVENLKQVWPQNLHDCMIAVRWLRANATKYRIDPGKIGAIGGSAGGHLVAMLAYAGDGDDLDPSDGPHADQSCRIQAVAPMYGVYDLLARAERRGLLADLSEADRELCRAASPVNYLNKGDPPVLLLHGTRDTLVPWKQSEMLHAGLQDAGLESDLHIIKGARHSFHLEPPQQDLRPLVIGFFNKHLK